MESNDLRRTPEGDEEDRVKKLLTGLRRVRTPHDFELRLHRRLTEERRRKLGRPVRMFSFVPFRIPVYAGSIIVIVVASVVTWYVLTQSGMTPEEFPSFKQEYEAAPLTDSVFMGERDLPAPTDEVPAALEKRSSRIHPQGQKAPSMPRSKESKDIVPAEDLRMRDAFRLPATPQVEKSEAQKALDRSELEELDTAAAKQDSANQQPERENQEPRRRE